MVSEEGHQEGAGTRAGVCDSPDEGEAGDAPRAALSGATHCPSDPRQGRRAGGWDDAEHAPRSTTGRSRIPARPESVAEPPNDHVPRRPVTPRPDHP